jgi:hypothetical protein
MKDKMLGYLETKALTDFQAAHISLDLLMNKPVGIGDHSTEDFTKNLDEALDKLVDAKDRLDMVMWIKENV